MCKSLVVTRPGCRFENSDKATLDKERSKVSLPLDEYIAKQLPAAPGTKRKKPRPRKVNAIFAIDLQAALLRQS